MERPQWKMTLNLQNKDEEEEERDARKRILRLVQALSCLVHEDKKRTRNVPYFMDEHRAVLKYFVYMLVSGI
jgi:hypothetical protein